LDLNRSRSLHLLRSIQAIEINWKFWRFELTPYFSAPIEVPITAAAPSEKIREKRIVFGNGTKIRERVFARDILGAFSRKKIEIPSLVIVEELPTYRIDIGRAPVKAWHHAARQCPLLSFGRNILVVYIPAKDIGKL
jgi:hypothetical protein